MATVDPKNLDIETSEVGLGTLGKAFKLVKCFSPKSPSPFNFLSLPSF